MQQYPRVNSTRKYMVAGLCVCVCVYSVTAK